MRGRYYAVLLVTIAMLAGTALAADQDLIVVRGARIITVSGKDYANGNILIRGTRIEPVGPDVTIPQ